MPVLLVVIFSQLLFTTSDLWGRVNMRHSGFHFSTFITWWFMAYVLIRSVATFGQLYVFTGTEVGKTMTLFGACSLVLVNIAGVLLLGEVLPVKAYVGIALAIAAILIVTFTK